MSANLCAAFCPATATIPACCGFAPHCAQKGVLDGTGVTKKPTVTVAGEPVMSCAVIVMWPVIAPTGRGLTDAMICKACGAVPLVGVTVSHGESLAAVKVSVPPPAFETVSEAAAGFAPPCAAVNDSEVAETERTGAGGGGITPALPQPTATTQKIPANIISAKRFMVRPSRIPGRIYDG